MTWFIFIGDMLVMLFMVALVVWMFMVAPDSEIKRAGMIPLEDEDYDAGSTLDKEKEMKTEKNTEKVAGVAHG